MERLCVPRQKDVHFKAVTWLENFRLPFCCHVYWNYGMDGNKNCLRAAGPNLEFKGRVLMFGKRALASALQLGVWGSL